MKEKIKAKELLTGRAEFRISRNDMFWKCCILDRKNDEFYHISWQGYNDAYWWDNISEKASVITCKGDKGTEKNLN